MNSIGDILNRLQKVKRLGDGSYLCLCPAHPDKNPSLHVTLKDETILLKCQAGCQTEGIVKEMGLEMADLFIKPGIKKSEPKVESKIVAEYNYQDEDGSLLYQVVRYEPKSFKQRHKNGNGEWDWNMTGIKRVLYHLPELKLTTDDTIYLVEGEKDADNLWQWGRVATTSPGGANSWRDEYSEYLKGKRVVIIPDKDTAGFSYGRQVVNSLTGKVSDLKCIILPGDAIKDVTDWLNAGGEIDTLPQLEQGIEALFTTDKPSYRLTEDAVQWDKKFQNLLLTFKAENISEERTGIHARISIFGQHEPLSWSYLNIERAEDRLRLSNSAFTILKTEGDYRKDDLRHDLDNFCAGLWAFHVSRFVPIELTGDDTPKPLSFYLKPYVLEGGGTIIFSPPGRGKSFSALLWAISIDAGCSKFWEVQQQKVLYINLERSSESLRRRLSMVNKVLGLSPTRPLFVLNARGKSLSTIIPACRNAIKKHSVSVIVLDSISRAGFGDLNENQPGNRIIDALSALCPTWLALGHTARASDDHLFGSIMQDAGADICVQLSSQIREDNVLGIGYLITKQNDIGVHGQKIFALEFDDNGLVNFRHSKLYEFPEIEGKNKQDMLTTIIDYVSNQDSGDATASEVAKEFGFNRVNIAKLFTKSGKFQQTRRVKQSVYYGVKQYNTEF